jgi:two-component system sensor histidine kinase RegB
LIEEVVAPHRNFGIAINVALPWDRTLEPVGARNPAIVYGLGNLVENAVDFARGNAEVTAVWSEEEVSITIRDDGPGFAADIMDRLGEPYVTSRRHRTKDESEETGLGLGFFIAKTLLERSGATLTFKNRRNPEAGAEVRLRWPRSEFEYQAPHVGQPDAFSWYGEDRTPGPEMAATNKNRTKADAP